MELFPIRHEVVDSTNERAFEAIASGAARHGEVHLAEGQNAGRGRRGHTWVSPAGEGLYLSLVLLPEAQPNPAALTMGAGLAVLEAVQELGAFNAQLKWPNDVVVPIAKTGKGAKLAGILVEARGLDPKRPHAVVGIGVNVRQETFPAELESERPVTSLYRLGLDRTLEEVRAALFQRLSERMPEACNRPDGVVESYVAACNLLGSRVLVLQGRNPKPGRLVGLDLGGIELEGADGVTRYIVLEHVQALESLD